MIIHNVIEACSDGRERILDLSERVVAVVHRTESGHDAFEVANLYRTNDEAGRITGYQMPYTFVIDRSGHIEQALKLSDHGPHARAWNSKGIGIGVIGDFRRHSAPAAQYKSLVWLLAVLGGWLGGTSKVFGHDELHDSMGDPLKQCPGELLDMMVLRDDVRLEMTGLLTSSGVVL